MSRIKERLDRLSREEREYFVRHSPTSAKEAGEMDWLYRLLTNFEFMEVKVLMVGPQPLIDDYDLSDEDTLRLIQHTLQLSASVLERYPEELLNQIQGRLGYGAETPSTLSNTKPHFRLESQSLTSPQGGLVRMYIHEAAVNACAFSPDGRYALSASDDKTLRYWDITSNRDSRVFVHGARVLECLFSLDGRYALSASADGMVYCWDLTTGLKVHEVRIPPLASNVGNQSIAYQGIALHPDGQRALVSRFYNNALQVWDIRTGKKVRSFIGQWLKAAATQYTFSPDGHYALSNHVVGPMRLWNVRTGKIVHLPRPGRRRTVRGGTFSPDGQLAIGTINRRWSFDDGVFTIWDIATGELLRTFEGSVSTRRGCDMSSDARSVLSVSEDTILRLWDVSTGQVVRSFQGHTGPVNDCAISPDGRYALSASDDKTLRLWDASSGRLIRVLEGHSGSINGCAFSPDGRYALSASDDQTLRLWDMDGEQRARILGRHRAQVVGCAFSPDGRHVLSVTAFGTMRIWEVGSGRKLHSFHRGLLSLAKGCTYSPDGRLALLVQTGRLCMWDITTGRMVRTFKGQRTSTFDLKFAADTLGALNINRAIFSPDGSAILSASDDQTLRLWDVRTGQPRQVMVGHTDRVHSCSFSFSGSHALSASADKTLRLWDARSWQEVARWIADGQLLSCTFHPSGYRVIAGDADGRVHFLSIEHLSPIWCKL